MRTAMLKIISPVLYASSLLLVGAVMIMTFGIHSGIPSDSDRLIVVLASTLIFLAFNIAMVKLEKLTNPTILDHLRQSAIWYLFIAASVLSYVIGSTDSPVSGFLIVPAPIAINALFLSWKRRTFPR